MMKEEIQGFIDYLIKELNFANNTVISYQRDLAMYMEYLAKEQLSFLDISREDVRVYLKYLSKKALKNSSISRHISCLRSFYNYLLLNGKIEVNVFKMISNPKLERKLPNFLSYEEMRIIFDSIDISTSIGLRNRLMIELFYASGCRVSELIAIKIQDIDVNKKTIRIMGKGSKERFVYYGEYAAYYLDLYLKDSRKKIKGSVNTDYLLLSKKGKALTLMEMEVIIRNLVKDLPLKSHVTPHTFRHTFATHLLNNGADIKTVQELLGHTNLNTTGIYTHVTNERLREVYLKAFPRTGNKL